MTDANPGTPPPSPTGRPARRRVRNRFRIKAEPQDLIHRKPPLKQRLLARIKTDWPGFVSSFAFHLVLLFLFWVILAPQAYRMLGGGGGGAMIDLLLSDLDEKAGKKTKEPTQPRKPAFAVNVKPVPNPKSKKKTVKKSGKRAGERAAAGPGPTGSMSKRFFRTANRAIVNGYSRRSIRKSESAVRLRPA